MKMIETLSMLRPASTFLTLKGYKSAAGEIADHTIIFHISYKTALEGSIATLSLVIPDNDLEAVAKAELLASYNKSLENGSTEPLEVIGEHYERVLDRDGKPIKGVKVHRETKDLYIFGLAHRKRVYIPGVYKDIKRRPLTIAKDKLRKGLSVEKFRQFVVKPGQVESIKVEHLSLLPE